MALPSVEPVVSVGTIVQTIIFIAGAAYGGWKGYKKFQDKQDVRHAENLKTLTAIGARLTVLESKVEPLWEWFKNSMERRTPRGGNHAEGAERDSG